MKEQLETSALKEQMPVVAETVSHVFAKSDFEYKETRELVELVHEAADQVRSKGEMAFSDFRVEGSRWRGKETYIFVLDPEGNMLVHPDPALEGKNELSLEDINGKYFISGMLGTVITFPDKQEGWYHYQWPVPGGLLPRWKSSYVQLVTALSGKSYVVGSGMYNDRMERVFVVDVVHKAVQEIEKRGKDAFDEFRDPTGPYMAKDSYIFVTDMNGVELVNPAFPNLEGRDLLDLKDTTGKYVNRELLNIIQTSGSGWLDYMWPKPGNSVSSRKSAYVRKAVFGDQEFMVGCGVYLPYAVQDRKPVEKMTALEVMLLVRQAAELLKEQGEDAWSEFRKKGSKWFHDDTYLFAFTLNGIRAFHAVEPESEGRDDSSLRDILGRPIVRMIQDVASGPSGEGWVHYMYPEPGNIFPAWKSSFVKKITFPSGKDYIVGCGIYNMKMNRSFIEDVVDRASALVATRGKEAFDELRDKKGPFFFMDTYVFVSRPDGTELVNAAQPSLEGKNLLDFEDLQGKPAIRDEIAAAMKSGSAWTDSYWYKPGENTPALKKTYLRKVHSDGEVFIVGSGIYVEDESTEFRKKSEVQKITWKSMEEEVLKGTLRRQVVVGEKATLARFTSKPGEASHWHSHFNEEYTIVLSGTLKYIFDNREVDVRAGDVLVIPANTPHSVVTMKDAEFIVFFAPLREDWLHGQDQYLRG